MQRWAPPGSVALRGPDPTWVTQLGDATLRLRLGAGTFERGAAYARDGAVVALSTGDHGHLLLATVRGSGRHPYQVLVTSSDDGAALFDARCSCPVQVDCKHVAAAILTARGQVGADVGALPLWESWLSEAVGPADAEPSTAPLGLQVEVVEQSTGRYDAARRRLRMVPVTPGRKGWIKTGVSWRDLELSHRGVAVHAAHRDALLDLLARFRAGQPPWAPPSAPARVHLDELGTGGLRLMEAAVAAGVTLLTPGGRRVQLADEPASVVVDVRLTDGDADTEADRGARLGLLVRVPGEDDRPVEAVDLVGDPPHALVVDDDDRLLLARFDPPLDPAVARLVHAPPLRIPPADVPRFVSTYYPALRQRVAVHSGDGSVELPEIRPPRLGLRVVFEPGHETWLRWDLVYAAEPDPVRVPLDDGAPDTALSDPAVPTVTRDRMAEQALLRDLDVLDAVPGLRSGPTLEPEARISGLRTAAFVLRVLPALTERGVLVEVEGTPAAYTQASGLPQIRLSAQDADDGEHPDWFDLDVRVSVDGQAVPLVTLLTALARGDEHLLLDSGTWFALDHPELATLQRLIEEARALQDRQSSTLRVTAWQAGLWDELVAIGIVEHQSERWTRTVGALLDQSALPRPPAPPGVLARLRPYQLEGYQWLCLLWDHRLGGILADDMGLGKTLQTLAMAARAHERGDLAGRPLLIVAPTSVVGTWAGEADRFCPQLRVVTITETSRRSGRSLADVIGDADLVVTSYALLRIDEVAYRDQEWSGLVLDEAQFVKNHQAKTYQAARRVPAPVKLAITGTPLENSLMDLWSLLSITAPGLFPSPSAFAVDYRKPIESGRSPDRLATLRRRIRPWVLRRTKEQVAQDLPPKIEQTLEVTLNPGHRRVYDKHLQRERQRVLGLIDDLDRNRIAILSALTMLRQLSLDASLVDVAHRGVISSSKIDALMEQLTEVVAEGHRVLVFSQFTGFLALVRARLDADGIAHCYLDGRTRDRPRRIAEFKDGDAPVFVISLKAGGVGLTLTEADYVFVLDPWWNPAAEAQAVDRTHRIGQDKTVMVYRLVAKDTIEEKVVALQQRKRDLFARVVDEGAMLGTQLSADDLRGLFDG